MNVSVPKMASSLRTKPSSGIGFLRRNMSASLTWVLVVSEFIQEFNWCYFLAVGDDVLIESVMTMMILSILRVCQLRLSKVLVEIGLYT